MCYNSKCRIKIESVIDGFASVTLTRGEVKKSLTDTRFDYELNGDKCTLKVKDNEVIQSRRGEQNIKMTFRKGKTTECFLGSGGFSGTFTIFTHDLHIYFGRVNTVFIVYTLGEQKIELKFTAENN